MPKIVLLKFNEIYRKIEHNEKVCPAECLGFQAKGQGRNQVRGQNCVSAITQKLLKQINKTSQKDRT